MNSRKRISILMDSDLYKKIRILQSEKIRITQTSYSFSNVVNDILRKSLKK